MYKEVILGQMLTPQEQRIIGGSVHPRLPNAEWYMPMGLVKGEVSFTDVTKARVAKQAIQGVITRTRSDGQLMQICPRMPLVELDPETYQTIHDPRVEGIDDIWNAPLDFDPSVEVDSALTEELYAQYENNRLNRRVFSPTGRRIITL